jgi:hypothetical protein
MLTVEANELTLHNENAKHVVPVNEFEYRGWRSLGREDFFSQGVAPGLTIQSPPFPPEKPKLGNPGSSTSVLEEVRSLDDDSMWELACSEYEGGRGRSDDSFSKSGKEMYDEEEWDEESDDDGSCDCANCHYDSIGDGEDGSDSNVDKVQRGSSSLQSVASSCTISN